MHQVAISFVGAGGDGAVAAGDIIAAACAADGLRVLQTEAYGPQIRGGESSCCVRISGSPLHAQADSIDTIVVFSWADFARFRDELVVGDGALVFHEATDAPPESFASRKLVPVPFAAMTREFGAPKSKNVIGLAIVAAVHGLPLDRVRQALARRFERKAPAIAEANLRAFDAGIHFAQERAIAAPKLQYEASAPRLLMSGNDACSVAAMHSRCRFFAGYPITPSSEVLQFLQEWLPKSGGTSIQTEDELSAIGAVIGASFAGTKSMTATSGPGLSLMSELLGLAAMAEIPAVVMNVQRGGPSTGIPTKSEQSDLAHAVYAGHGDMPRVVIGCSDVEDTFHATVDAFNISEEFQLPVVILSDQFIAQRKETVDAAAFSHEVIGRRAAANDGQPYLRYRNTVSGVSPMSHPGEPGGIYQTNGLEHDERGRPSSMFLVHEQMNAKRYRKLEGIAEKYPLVRRFGAEGDLDLGILCWGSSAGAVREAVELLERSGLRAGALVPRMLEPLPARAVQQFVDSCREILVVELSHAAQFFKHLRTTVDLPRGRTRVHARSGAKLLTPAEVLDEARKCFGVRTREVTA